MNKYIINNINTNNIIINIKHRSNFHISLNVIDSNNPDSNPELPHPGSPTTATTSPFLIENERSSKNLESVVLSVLQESETFDTSKYNPVGLAGTDGR